jgi:acyl-coenzyme A synthetase/AMP-(fatty) acid ligase
LPKTTSGKIQRSLTRQSWLEGRFEDLAVDAD